MKQRPRRGKEVNARPFTCTTSMSLPINRLPRHLRLPHFIFAPITYTSTSSRAKQASSASTMSEIKPASTMCNFKAEKSNTVPGPATPPPNKKTSVVSVAQATESYLPLGQLTFGTACTVRVMVCRKWESTDLKGKPISIDYIISDEHGGAIHCTTWSGVAHRFTTTLQEGECCSIKGFTVKPNKDKFRLRNQDKHSLQLEASTVVKHLDCDVSLFQRYPFDLIPLEEIAPNGSRFLLDVIGIVCRIGQINPTRNNSQLLDIHIQNERGRQIRVTLWGSLCDEFVRRNAEAQPNYLLILPGEIYLSSTSATIIYDREDISEIKAFRESMKHTDLPIIGHPLGPQVPREGTLLQLLHLGREQKTDGHKQSITLNCKVKIENIRTKHGWYYFSCDGGKCKKGVTRVGEQFWCESCSKICEYPQTRYQLHLDISDDSASVGITVFDELAETLLKKGASKMLEELGDDADESVLPPEIHSLTNMYHVLELKTHTYFNHGDHESFTASRIVCVEAATLHTKPNPTLQKSLGGNAILGEAVEIGGKTVAQSQKRKLRHFSSGQEQAGDLHPDHNAVGLEGVITEKTGNNPPSKKKLFVIEDEE